MPFGLTQLEVCELVRVALRAHHSPTSKIVAIAVRMLRKENPGIRMLVSYADLQQQHVGTIY
ncbi:MAG: protein Mom, partial [Parcubacteria group bacterium]|nr:protein Mom [Parcubacteria group bacterium]